MAQRERIDINQQLLLHFANQSLLFSLPLFNSSAGQTEHPRCGDRHRSANDQQFGVAKDDSDHATFSACRRLGLRRIHNLLVTEREEIDNRDRAGADPVPVFDLIRLAFSFKHRTLTQSSYPFDPDRLASAETQKCYTEALRICQRLVEAGHVAYFAGGCVRDALLERQPKDFDVATDATPARVREVFGKKRTLAFGASFGVIAVLPHRSTGGFSASADQNLMMPTEVATFRSDGTYSDGRRPDKVSFGDARNDAFRRDFTINGLFYDPAAGQVIDFVGGQDDLAKQLLRTIGRASERFEEDKLRMLRAVRFATTLGFALDDETQTEMTRLASEISVVSGERIGAEMRRILVAPEAASGLRLLVETGLDRVIWPTLSRCRFNDFGPLVGHTARNGI